MKYIIEEVQVLNDPIEYKGYFEFTPNEEFLKDNLKHIIVYGNTPSEVLSSLDSELILLYNKSIVIDWESVYVG